MPPPCVNSDLRGPVIHRALGFHLHPQRAVHRQGEQRQHADQNRVPVQNSGLFAQPKVRPQGLKEIPAGVEGNAAHDISESRAKKNRQKQA